ncbi:MAG TPA: NAD-dependent deacylase [Vineibacter sp.]|nr:NAD-dependent deacylase [Vineibacter sp.]
MHQDVGQGCIVVLTGAGISKESGIDTFRDEGGLWTKFDIEEVATIEAWHRDKRKVLDFYNQGLTWFQGANIRPNAAHDALARLESQWPGDVLVVTQNIDLLHEGAGSKNVLHMHGQAGKIRCMVCQTIIDSDMPLDVETVCPHCGARGQLRPHVVWFGEMPLRMDEIYAALDRCSLFVSIGTSGTVYPAAGFVEHVRRRVPRAHTAELNLEPSDGHSLFKEHVYGPATRIVPAYVDKVLTTGWR